MTRRRGRGSGGSNLGMALPTPRRRPARGSRRGRPTRAGSGRCRRGGPTTVPRCARTAARPGRRTPGRARAGAPGSTRRIWARCGPHGQINADGRRPVRTDQGPAASTTWAAAMRSPSARRTPATRSPSHLDGRHRAMLAEPGPAAAGGHGEGHGRSGARRRSRRGARRRTRRSRRVGAAGHSRRASSWPTSSTSIPSFCCMATLACRAPEVLRADADQVAGVAVARVGPEELVAPARARAVRARPWRPVSGMP